MISFLLWCVHQLNFLFLFFLHQVLEKNQTQVCNNKQCTCSSQCEVSAVAGTSRKNYSVLCSGFQPAECFLQPAYSYTDLCMVMVPEWNIWIFILYFYASCLIFRLLYSLHLNFWKIKWLFKVITIFYVFVCLFVSVCFV